MLLSRSRVMRIKRREFLIGVIVLGIGSVPFFRSRLRGLETTAANVLQRLCDLILPAHGSRPGAVALGIDREVLATIQESKQARLGLLLLTQSLGGAAFLALPEESARSQIHSLLARAKDDDPPQTARLLDSIYRDCAESYFTREESWSAIGYRIPQPHGYANYTRPPVG
jgi:hypothetical protein